MVWQRMPVVFPANTHVSAPSLPWQAPGAVPPSDRRATLASSPTSARLRPSGSGLTIRAGGDTAPGPSAVLRVGWLGGPGSPQGHSDDPSESAQPTQPASQALTVATRTLSGPGARVSEGRRLGPGAPSAGTDLTDPGHVRCRRLRDSDAGAALLFPLADSSGGALALRRPSLASGGNGAALALATRDEDEEAPPPPRLRLGLGPDTRSSVASAAIQVDTQLAVRVASVASTTSAIRALRTLFFASSLQSARGRGLGSMYAAAAAAARAGGPPGSGVEGLGWLRLGLYEHAVSGSGGLPRGPAATLSARNPLVRQSGCPGGTGPVKRPRNLCLMLWRDRLCLPPPPRKGPRQQRLRGRFLLSPLAACASPPRMRSNQQGHRTGAR